MLDIENIQIYISLHWRFYALVAGISAVTFIIMKLLGLVAHWAFMSGSPPRRYR